MCTTTPVRQRCRSSRATAQTLLQQRWRWGMKSEWGCQVDVVGSCWASLVSGLPLRCCLPHNSH